MQYSLKKGPNKYPKKGAEAVIKEIIQLHNRDAMDTLAYGSLTSEYKREALNPLIFLKEKRVISINGRACTFGS